MYDWGAKKLNLGLLRELHVEFIFRRQWKRLHVVVYSKTEGFFGAVDWDVCSRPQRKPPYDETNWKATVPGLCHPTHPTGPGEEEPKPCHFWHFGFGLKYQWPQSILPSLG
ncbi:unnamed protein product [Thelazia callipaeda]|uniref:Uncharacterized protein n=1 Tax=Thelazia callipaeda TaxID=103827 RepID=A0A0N5CXJ0_THECL|nr:unnamed protein product [Thelazia callipaeda]